MRADRSNGSLLLKVMILEASEAERTVGTLQENQSLS